MRNWNSFGRHSQYVGSADRRRRGEKYSLTGSGESRPLCRGWLHFLQTLAIGWWFCARAAARAGSFGSNKEDIVESAALQSTDCTSLALFLIGKFCCVCASANLHMVQFRREKDYRLANAADWACIVLSGWSNVASIATYAHDSDDPLYYALVFGPLVLSAFVGRSTWQAGDLQASPEARRRSAWMSKTTILLGLFVSAAIDAAYLPRDATFPYVGRLILILCGFFLWQAKSSCPGLAMPWHCRDVWGGHEDFHLLIFIADALLYRIYVDAGVFGPRARFFSPSSCA